ncbi:MAG TPA: radical SAM protein [Lentimicrobium sp.]|nr:radical SAM protein [Lentimicrobium sp.]
MQSKKKLILVNPILQGFDGLMQDASIRMMPIALGIVAALTPDEWETELIDEAYEKFTLTSADLVAFTSFTANAPRAYEIAGLCRKAGIYTVMGGVHATMCQHEALQYIDTIVTGEAEGAWVKFLSDLKEGKPSRIYEGNLVDMNDVPFVRRDIFKKYPYVYDLVQTSRGCPMGCDFCSVTQMCGKSYRERDVEVVLDELEQTDRPLLFFSDDNLVNNNKGAQERAIRLFKGMVERKMNKVWFSQAALNFADNDEVLYWARKSGCVMILLGVEAETWEALTSIKKNLNIRKGLGAYDEIFRKIHRHGIGILATIIFALETDTIESLYARRDFLKNSSADGYQCTVLTPLPGTTLYERMDRNRQIMAKDYPNDWRFYNGVTSVVELQHLTRKDVTTTMKDIWLSLYTKEPVRRRLFRTLLNSHSFKTAYWAYGINHAYSRMFLEGIYHIDKDSRRKRSFYLQLTDQILKIFYLLPWRKFSARFGAR